MLRAILNAVIPTALLLGIIYLCMGTIPPAVWSFFLWSNIIWAGVVVLIFVLALIFVGIDGINAPFKKSQFA